MTQARLDGATVMAAVDDCLDADRRDGLGGGIATATLADELGFGQGTIAKHCRRLTDADELVQVQGVSPSGKKARVSYLPADHPDAPTDDGQAWEVGAGD
jgi:hypothetical protein